MNIYSTVDGNNIDKIIILFNSVYENTQRKDELKFFLLVDKFPKEIPYIPDYIKDKLEIKDLVINEAWTNLLKDFNENFYRSAKWCRHIMNFSRFLFFKHFPEIERVTYLDWDMIVQGDIFELEENYHDKENMIVVNTGGNSILNNVFEKKFYNPTSLLGIYDRRNKVKNHKISEIIKILKISYSDFKSIQGFNAGFYIVSNFHFDENFLINHLKKLINIQKNLNCFNFGTQVVMNLMHVKNRVLIDKAWNSLPIEDNLEELKIIHWNGTKKPWNSVNSNNKIWYDYCFKVYPEHKDKYSKLKLLNFQNKKEDEITKDNEDITKRKFFISNNKPLNRNNLFLKYLASR